jgi:hypothetical protein
MLPTVENAIILKGLPTPAVASGRCGTRIASAFAGDVLAVEFSNDPEVSIYTLPTGMELDTKSAGHSVALLTEYQFTGRTRNISIPPVINVADSAFS